MFKTKHKKNVVTDMRITLDAKHNEMVQKMQDEQKKIPDKKQSMESLQKTLQTLLQEDKSQWTDDQWNRIYKLENEIDQLKKEIKKMEEKDDIADYFLNTAHILYQYYNQLDTNEIEDDPTGSYPSGSHITGSYPTGSHTSGPAPNIVTPPPSMSAPAQQKPEKKKKVIIVQKEEPVKWKKKNVLDFFKQSGPVDEQPPSVVEEEPSTPIDEPPPPVEEEVPEDEEEDEDEPKMMFEQVAASTIDKEATVPTQTEVKHTITMSDYLDTNQEIKFHRSELLEEYLRIVDTSYQPTKPKIYNYDYCQTCHVEKVLYSSEGTIICEKCGEVDYIMVESDKPSYKDPPPEVSYFAYCILLWAEKLHAIGIRITNGKNIYMSWIVY
jgi:hypothetical protein